MPNALLVVTEHDTNRFILAEKSTDIDFNNPEHKQILKDLVHTFCGLSGAKGLAAPQVGHNVRAFVLKDKVNDCRLVCNPEIISAIGRVKWKEQCLSFPNRKPVKMLRRQTVHLKYYDIDGNERTHVFQGFDAACILHEYDHLEGKTLFTI